MAARLEMTVGKPNAALWLRLHVPKEEIDKREAEYPRTKKAEDKSVARSIGSLLPRDVAD